MTTEATKVEETKKDEGEFDHEEEEMGEIIHLNWRDENPGPLKLHFLFKHVLYTDFKILVTNKDGKEKAFSTHRVVLMAQSSVFEQELSFGHGDNTLTLKDIDHGVFQVFLEGLYWEHKVVDSIPLAKLLLVWALAKTYKVDEFYNYVKGKVEEAVDNDKTIAESLLDTCIEMEEFVLYHKCLGLCETHAKHPPTNEQVETQAENSPQQEQGEAQAEKPAA